MSEPEDGTCGKCEFYGEHRWYGRTRTDKEAGTIMAACHSDKPESKWCPPYLELVRVRHELRKVMKLSAEMIQDRLSELDETERRYGAAIKEVEKRGKLQVIGVLRSVAENFSENITRAAADLAAKIHDDMDPRDDVVVVLGNCANAFKDLILSDVQGLENDVERENG